MIYLFFTTIKILYQLKKTLDWKLYHNERDNIRFHDDAPSRQGAREVATLWSKMKKYTYSIQLRIWHPTEHPDVFTNILQLEPSKISVVGEPRRTPKGGILKGNYKESYWWGNPLNIRGYSSIDFSAEESLSKVIDLLEPHASFFEKVCNEGGRVLLEIYSHGEENYAFLFSPKLLAKCAATNLSLVLDVYPEKQNW